MNPTINVNLKNITGEFYGLSKPGAECDTEIKDATKLTRFEAFKKVCESTAEHNNRDMTTTAALLLEMHNSANIPDEYSELSECFASMVKANKKLDISESRDYVFFAYDAMRELEKLDNAVECNIEGETDGLFACAAQDDDISSIVIVNDTENDYFIDVVINGLPGRSTAIDYYFADEYNQLSILCNTDTKLETTTVKIMVSAYSLHLFKIR